MPLARKLARRYVHSHEPYEDLVQVANLGLVKAVEHFDPDRGLAFSSYAVPTIVGELKRYFRDLGWTLHVERGAKERARAIAAAREELTGQTGRQPTVNELAQYLEYSAEDVLDGLEALGARDPISLDEPLAGGDAGTPLTRVDALGALDQRLELADDLVSIADATAHLPLIERRVLYLRFGEDLSQTEIAARVGVSQMQVSRLLRRSLDRLRDFVGDRRS